MKTIGIIFSLFLAITVTAQEDFNEQLVVPLSNPNARGTLKIGLIRGDIKVETYSGKEVIVDAFAKGGSGCDDCDKKSAPAGMKKIASSSVEFSVTENRNFVHVKTNSWKKPIHLTVKLPANFDLDISTVHGKISVSGVNGSMEVSTVHGPLTFTDVSGSIVCNTVHGKVHANFKKVTPDEPMAFVTLHGDVDITFPSGTKATAKMKSDRGEIFTDFDMAVDKSKPERNSSSGSYKVSVNSWVHGKINGGGPEYTFKSMSGDILIREK